MFKRHLLRVTLVAIGLVSSPVGFAKKLEHLKYVPISKKLVFAPKTALADVSVLEERQLLAAGYQPIGVVSVVLREYHCKKKDQCEALSGTFDATRLAREKAAQYGADVVTLWSDNRDFVRSRSPTGLAKLRAPKNCTRKRDERTPMKPGQTAEVVECVVEADYLSRTLFVEARGIAWHHSRSDDGWDNTKEAVKQLDKLFRQTHKRSYRRAVGFGYEEAQQAPAATAKVKLSKRDRRDNLDVPKKLPPMLAAAWFGDIDGVKRQLAAGELTADAGAAGNTVLHYTAVAGRAEVISLLLQSGMPVAPRNRHGVTPLYLAARYGHTEAVNVLLDAGADIDDQSLNFMDLTAAMAAAKYGHREVLQALMARGADLARKDKEGKDVLAHALAAGHNHLVAPLLQRFGAQPPADILRPALYVAVRANNTEAVAILLARGADIDTRYTPAVSRTYTPLLLAVAENHLETVELLLEAGADPNADIGVGSPLSLNLKVRANTRRDQMERNAAVAMALVRAGADSDHGRLVRKIVIPKAGQDSGHAALVEYLLEPGRLSRHNLGLLYRAAAAAGRVDYLRKIVAMAGPDSVTPDDPKVFHGAIGSGSVETIDYLLTRGMPIDAALNRAGETALILAAKYGHPEIVAELLRRGADVTKANSRGETAYDLAYRGEQLRIVKALAARRVAGE
ncbi:hypothetical protein FKG94_14115 [Exilibacterium tricleocarpae]|uniref:Uncharacterized protein n=1 Tax=Exilibacterium tricleocarpae TaxID=2591008 RepID=A0A545TLU5_9GAMM|nr:ankyrin repeat domain-containing protein [Exilibacterium tricleocarpae]TQV78202.1 hypothetical protein FKG94_14115 [Exilibacterium tricleocarpae]